MFRFLRAGAIALLLLVLAEVALRVTLGLGNPLLYTNDSATGYIVRPSQHVTRFGAANSINAYSMRSPEITPAKPADTFRVLFVGDSIAYGTTFVDQRNVFTQRLADDLQTPNTPKTQCLDAACGGWATGNELGYLQSRGTFQSDLVVFVLNPTDFCTSFNAAGTTETQRPPCALYELIARYVVRPLCPPPVPAAEQVPLDQQAREHTAAALANLERARCVANNDRAAFAVVYVPAGQSEFNTPQFQRSVDELAAWARAHDVPLIDTTAALHERSDAKVYVDGMHLSAAGQALLAQTLHNQWPALASPDLLALQDHTSSNMPLAAAR